MELENAIKAGKLGESIISLKEKIALFKTQKKKSGIECFHDTQISFGLVETTFASPFGPKITYLPKKYTEKILEVYEEYLTDLEKELRELN